MLRASNRACGGNIPIEALHSKSRIDSFGASRVYIPWPVTRPPQERSQFARKSSPHHPSSIPSFHRPTPLSTPSPQSAGTSCSSVHSVHFLKRPLSSPSA